MIVEPSAVGRIVIPDSLPLGFALFYTTRDFPGRLEDESVALLLSVVRDRFAIDATLTTCSQVHGAAVRRGSGRIMPGTQGDAEGESEWIECDACDALWTADRHAALGIKVADCLPVTMIDCAHHVIANVHSGWRGAVQRITAVTVSDLESRTTFDASNAFAFLGPSIRRCCFEVGEEVVTQFAGTYEGLERFLDRSRSKPHIDQPGLTRELLISRGFRAERIIDSELCTRCDGSLFHSFRRDARNGGRNLSVVAQ